MRWLFRLNSGLAKIEETCLTIALLGMIFFAFLQVIMRNVFSSSMIWSDSLVRHLVLWIGFMGASLATKQRHHIRIDFLNRLLPKMLCRPAAIFIDLFAAVVSFILCKAGWHFVMEEKAMGTTLFLDLPAWMVQMIIPASFLFIGFRFLLNIVFDLTQKDIQQEPTPL